MSSVVNSPSSYTYTQLPQDDGTAEAQQLAAQIQQALMTGNTASLQSLGSTATSLLGVLDTAQEQLTTSLAAANLPMSTASALFTQLDAVESSATLVQNALTAVDNALGTAFLNGSPSSPSSIVGNGSAPPLLPSGSESTGSGAFSLTFSTPSGNESIPISNSDIMSLLQNDPDILNSLKAYVKGQAQQSLLDAIMNALGGGSGNTQSSGSGSTSGGGRAGAGVGAGAGAGAGGGAGAPQVALNPGGGPTGTSGSGSGLTGTGGGSAGSTGTSNSFGAPNTGTSGSNTGNGNGLTFTSSPTAGGAAATNGQQPTVSSNLQLTQGGAQSGNGNTASIDGWDANLGFTNPGNIDEFLMMVLLACYEDGQKGLEQMAQQLQKTNNQKKALRSELSGLYNQKTGNEQTDTAVNAQIQNVQGQLSNTSDDAQLQQLQLQNATQNQQQLLQEISSFSKNLYDASMNILRKIGA